ncbi:MAG: hypothetical protein AABZ12_12280 [Planctomycetota bacterium]
MPMSTLGTPSPWPLRRGRERGIAGGVLNLLVCAGLVAQPDQNPEPPPERASDASAATNEKENEGLWPSPKLLESLLSRWADEASNEYSLDDVQGKQVRKAVVGRWKGFLDEHRRELQPIANEFLEMRLGMEPPSKERVREWAERAFPTFDRVKQEFMASQDDFRQALHPTQRAKFELDMLKQSAGMQFAENKLRQWKTGDVDATEFWEPLPSARRRRGEEKHRHIEQTAPSSALGTTVGDAAGSSDPIEVELSAWEKYVADFIRAYDLDEGQRTTVLSCLRELSERAAAHRTLHRDEIQKLENRIAAARGAEGEPGEIQAELVRLYGPIDEMFAELKDRIEKVPTEAQRAKAAGIPHGEKPSEGASERRRGVEHREYPRDHATSPRGVPASKTAPLMKGDATQE